MQMKEVLTKSFWQGVKKTYEDALKGVPEEDKKVDKAIVASTDAPAAAPEESEHK
jgi:hypothetical protein